MAFSLGDVDEQVVEAALSFIDEFAVDQVESKGPSTNEVAPSDDKKRQRAERKKMLRRTGVYANPNRARNERRWEIAALREQIQKLQIDLTTLRNRKSDRPSAASRPCPAAGSLVMSKSSQITAAMWQEIADRQQRRREEAECENTRLKLVLKHQRKVANTLSSLLQRRANQLVTECSPFMTPVTSTHHIAVNVLDLCGDVGDFQDLFRRLDTAYQEVDAVFSANGLDSMVISPSDVHIREGEGGKYLELFANKVMPFESRDTKEATWDHFRGTEKHWGTGSLYSKSAKDLQESCTIIEDFTKEVYSNNISADIRIKQVLRRYVEKDRDIVVWTSRASPVAIKHEMLRGLTYTPRICVHTRFELKPYSLTTR
ncbi:hypothetical protein PHYBOEH_007724 [Phytophthora boehmeriae]|uniref:M96 mating-specific protein family n=1 Tax=Phytophthora boehmeriae TaxID=109152 RepID=A0A8T1X744_9STRA|nr:hypothetical protein PHYBOEH_007724 [Phytophthora boehmeriae]